MQKDNQQMPEVLMTEMWELSNKDFKSVMIKNFSNQLQTSLEQRDKQKIESPQRNRRYVKFTGWAQPRMEGT